MTPAPISPDTRLRLRLARFGLDEIADVVLAAGLTFDRTFTAFAAIAAGALTDARAGRVREATETLRIIAADHEIPDAVYDALADLITREILAHFPTRRTLH